jgi:DNA-binding IclR family transcriptional regulator
MGVTAIAAPVFGLQGRVLATISFVWFTPQLAPRAEELGAILRDIGLHLSAELGFRIPEGWQDRSAPRESSRLE